MAVKQTPAERIADLTARIADIQDVWVDSDAQEIAEFEQALPELHAEIAAIRAAVETATAARAWKSAAKRAVKAVTALSITSELDFAARHKESARILHNLGNAQQRAFAQGLDVSAELVAVWATVAPAREAAGVWYAGRLALALEKSAGAARSATQRALTPLEQQYNAELRAAFSR